MRLHIGGPTRDDAPASTKVDACYLFAYTREMGPWGRNVDIGWISSTYTHVGREAFLEAAIKQGATHILWLDSDMGLPRTTALQLHAHDQPVVGCNYRARRSGQWTAQRDTGERIPTLERSTGLEAVDVLGMGVFFMRVDVIERLGRPWFRHGLNAARGDIGEDIMFCKALREAGYTIWLDHDLSKEIEHIGQHAYRYDDTPAVVEVPI